MVIANHMNVYLLPFLFPRSLVFSESQLQGLAPYQGFEGSAPSCTLKGLAERQVVTFLFCTQDTLDVHPKAVWVTSIGRSLDFKENHF